LFCSFWLLSFNNIKAYRVLAKGILVSKKKNLARIFKLKNVVSKYSLTIKAG